MAGADTAPDVATEVASHLLEFGLALKFTEWLENENADVLREKLGEARQLTRWLQADNAQLRDELEKARNATTR